MASSSQVYTWEPSNAAIAARYGLRPDEILRFDTNTSPLPPPFAADVLGAPFDPPLNEYPDSSYADLTEAAAEYAHVDPTEVVVGAGADEVIDLVAKAYLPAGSAALVPVPTYPMYGVLTSQRAARIIAVPRLGPADRFGLVGTAMVAKLPEVSVVWLCSPNNPTGTVDEGEAMESVLQEAAKVANPPLIVIDQAYREFVTSENGRGFRFPNILFIRTLSKAFALPGIRVGYGIGPRPVIERLERVRPPGSISTPSAQIATHALRNPGYAHANAAALATEREWLAPQLARLDWQPTPSVTNFLLVRIGDNDAAERAAHGLLRAGIVPRTFGPANPLRGYLRLTVRSRAENEKLLRAVADVGHGP